MAASLQQEIVGVQYACYSSLTFIVWEWLITLSFEVDIIWRKETPRYTKLLYCTPRYLGLISLIWNTFMMSYIHLVNPKICRWWHGFQVLTADVMLLSLEILLMVRVFALYDRKQWIAVFLGAVLGLKTTALIILSALTLGMITFGNACLVKRAPRTVVYISFLDILIQTLFWAATLYKYLRTRWESGWQTIPLLTLVTRDSAFTFALLLVLYVMSMVDAINGAAFHHMGFPICVAITSLSSCRLIMNMRTFTFIQPGPEDDDAQLTTLIM